MEQAVLRVDGLPEGALEAATAFHAQWLPQALDLLQRNDDTLVLLFPAAPYDHSGWRRAAVRDLARRVTPKRVNLVAGENPAAIEATLAWLAAAPGVTGQLLNLAPSEQRA